MIVAWNAGLSISILTILLSTIFLKVARLSSPFETAWNKLCYVSKLHLVMGYDVSEKLMLVINYRY